MTVDDDPSAWLWLWQELAVLLPPSKYAALDAEYRARRAADARRAEARRRRRLIQQHPHRAAPHEAWLRDHGFGETPLDDDTAA